MNSKFITYIANSFASPSEDTYAELKDKLIQDILCITLIIDRELKDIMKNGAKRCVV